jgi:hypothetical protein
MTATIDEVLHDLEAANAAVMDAITDLRGAAATLQAIGEQAAGMDNGEQAAAAAELEEQVNIKAALFSAQRHGIVELAGFVEQLRSVTG